MVYEINGGAMPERLAAIPQPPEQLYVRTEQRDTFQDLLDRPRVAIVGTRKISAYGQEVTARLAAGLARSGVVVISGLAFGVDAAAHRAVLEAGGMAIAVLPGPVEEVAPRSHVSLAEHIVANGGALVSEYPAGSDVYRLNFIERNRIVSALSDALLITEAAENSGTMHTAGFAMEQGIDVLAVPGNVTSPTSVGTNNLIKTGATPVTDVGDILDAIGHWPDDHDSLAGRRAKAVNADEQRIIDLLGQGISDGHRLLDGSGLSVELFNHHMTMLEITSRIRALGANHWGLA